MTTDLLSAAVQSAVDGEASALEVFALLKTEEKKMQDFFDKAKEQIEEAALNEANTFTEKSFEFKNYKIEKRQGRAIYNYKNVGIWNRLKEKMSTIEKLSKLASESRNFGKTIVDDDTGEVIEPCEVKYSKDVLIIKNQ